MAKSLSNVKRLQNELLFDIKKLSREIVEAGYEEALSTAYNSSGDVLTDGTVLTPDVDVDLIETDNGYEIVLSGEDAMFVEFGAGVHFNSSGYPTSRPQGVVGIGQYGYKQGRKDTWTFEYGGERVRTYGTPASMPLYKARKAIIERLKND